MSGRVVIVGWGVAGLAATHAARSRGAHVILLGSGVGATSLFPGAVDDIDWSEREAAAALSARAPAAEPLEAEARAFSDALGVWELAADRGALPLLAATSGVLRSARGRDRALLDVAAVEGRTVLVPRAPRAGWDADALVRSLRDETRGKIAFQVIEAPVLRFGDESRISDADLAARHDEDARLDWLAARLAPFVERAGKAHAAVLLGPWLGVLAERAGALGGRLGCPVGEALLAGSCVPGLRFEAAREAWLGRAGVDVVRGRATAITRREGPLRVELAAHPAIDCDAVVLAAGGLVGGGILYDPPEHRSGPEGAERMRPPFSSTIVVDGARVASGVNGVASSAFGPVLDASAWPRAGSSGALERAGMIVDASSACAPNVFAAGDVVFGDARTMLRALGSGLLAGAHAASAALQNDGAKLEAAQ